MKIRKNTSNSVQNKIKVNNAEIALGIWKRLYRSLFKKLTTRLPINDNTADINIYATIVLKYQSTYTIIAINRATNTYLKFLFMIKLY